MAGITEFRHIRDEQLGCLRGVGVVAPGAAHADSGVNRALRKGPFVMACIAEVRDAHGKQFGIVRGMRVVAGGAPHAEGGMNGALLKECLVMASETQLRLLCRQSFSDGALHFMRNISWINRGVTARASHVDCRVFDLFASQVRMAHQAVNFLCKS